MTSIFLHAFALSPCKRLFREFGYTFLIVAFLVIIIMR